MDYDPVTQIYGQQKLSVLHEVGQFFVLLLVFSVILAVTFFDVGVAHCVSSFHNFTDRYTFTIWSSLGSLVFLYLFFTQMVAAHSAIFDLFLTDFRKKVMFFDWILFFFGYIFDLMVKMFLDWLFFMYSG